MVIGIKPSTKILSISAKKPEFITPDIIAEKFWPILNDNHLSCFNLKYSLSASNDLISDFVISSATFEAFSKDNILLLSPKNVSLSIYGLLYQNIFLLEM